LANGGDGVNDLDEPYSYNLNGIGVEKASEIALQNLINYVDPNSTYINVMQSSIEIAINKYGLNSIEVNEVIEAWRAVGLDDSEFNPIKWLIVNVELNGIMVINPTFFL